MCAGDVSTLADMNIRYFWVDLVNPSIETCNYYHDFISANRRENTQKKKPKGKLCFS